MSIRHPHMSSPLHVTSSGHRLVNVTHMHETPHLMAPAKRATKTSGAPAGYRKISNPNISIGYGNHGSPYERTKSMSPGNYATPYKGKHRR